MLHMRITCAATRENITWFRERQRGYYRCIWNKERGNPM